MTSEPGTARAEAKEPNDLFKLFVQRANAGDLEGLVALYEPQAVAVFQPTQPTEGIDAIRAALEGMLATNPVFSAEGQRPAVVSGDLALTSAVLAPGVVTAEVARRQPDGGWLWVIDNPDFMPKGS